MVIETLAEYLKRIMRERKMKVGDLVAASGLSQTYLNSLLRGAQTNLTIETIAALSQALGVEGFEIFTAAYGKAPDKTSVDLHVLVDAINKLILNPMLVELVHNTSKLESNRQAVVYDAARMLAKNGKAKKKNNK
jgi:transcriptional regulator with XRE-family HTH domain